MLRDLYTPEVIEVNVPVDWLVNSDSIATIAISIDRIAFELRPLRWPTVLCHCP